MSILQFIVALIIIGVGLGALNQFVTMEPTIKKLVNLLVVLLVCLWVLGVFGILPLGPHVRLR